MDPRTIDTVATVMAYVIFFIIILFLPQKTDAWGSHGHEIVANIAYGRLSSSSRNMVKSILNLHEDDDDDGGGSIETSSIGRTGTGTSSGTGRGKNHTNDDLLITPLSQIATWADRVRFTKLYHWSVPLHFVDVKDGQIDGGCSCTRSTAATTATLGEASADLDSAAVGDALHGRDGEDGSGYCVPISSESCWFDYQRDCSTGMCAVGAIANYTKRLQQNSRGSLHRTDDGGDGGSSMLRGTRQTDTAADAAVPGRTAASAWTAKEALMFLTHFVGDIHQPLHASRASDRGGNSIHVRIDHHPSGATGVITKEKETNLHSVWDDHIIEFAITTQHNSSALSFQQSILDLVAEAESTGLIDLWLGCSDGMSTQCPSVWAEESFDDALRWAYSDEHGREIVDGAALSVEYFGTRLHVVKRKLAAGGVRLAAVLEAALSDRDLVRGSPADGTSKLVELLVGWEKLSLLLK
mmetsp:Transcript_36767/g.74892  ORF Transcript_36767/g.74892 Transcript_36767/m.74892 type:complete len:467 (-) Transcript_36767:1838-3238(-)|eukprot:CAMPEP_0178485010 /NCGR_PEP_ID=MMETSP0696-20121128/8052_1 /TAXON_ID=265572 /ORGANISM="Extubocellulus spinifer, Strain CCMP396" /LENGTH=466 /DNA_ID=CAMNT_0020112591 /DNA_START=291 /DNA_END=1691 /DNA_ORIENTATION=-